MKVKKRLLWIVCCLLFLLSACHSIPQKMVSSPEYAVKEAAVASLHEKDGFYSFQVPSDWNVTDDGLITSAQFDNQDADLEKQESQYVRLLNSFDTVFGSSEAEETEALQGLFAGNDTAFRRLNALYLEAYGYEQIGQNSYCTYENNEIVEVNQVLKKDDTVLYQTSYYTNDPMVCIEARSAEQKKVRMDSLITAKSQFGLPKLLQTTDWAVKEKTGGNGVSLPLPPVSKFPVLPYFRCPDCSECIPGPAGAARAVRSAA